MAVAATSAAVGEPGDADEDADGDASVVDALPDELLLAILALVPTRALAGAVRGVCRRWRALSQCASLWRGRDALYEQRTSPRSLFCWTLRVAPELHAVTFKNSVLGEDVVDAVLQGCERVRRLSFAVAPRDPAAPSAVAAIVGHYSAHLQELHLHLDCRQVRDAAQILRALGTLGALRELRLGGRLAASAEDRALAVLALRDHCTSLEAVHVESLDEGWGPGFVADLANALGARLKRVSLPKRLVVVPDSVVQEVAAAATGLVSLAGDFGVVAFVGGLPSLSSLRLWYTYWRSGPELLRGPCGATSGAARLAARLHDLALELDDEVEFAAAMLHACTSLRRLHLHGDRLDRQLPHLLRAVPATVTHLRLSGQTRQQLGPALQGLQGLADVEVEVDGERLPWRPS